MGRGRAAQTSWVAFLLIGLAAASADGATKRRPASASSQGAGEAGFDLTRLPKGKNVTIPRPATTFVPLTDAVTFTATDIPQTVSFRPVNRRSGPVGPLRLSIDDGGPRGAQQIELRPGTPFLYNFKSLASITVVTEAGGGEASGLSLQVESDKPLEIAH